MTLFECVDLASQAWGAIVGDDAGEVHTQFSAIGFPDESKAVESLTYLFRPDSTKLPDWLIIEDVPYNMMQSSTIKDVSRMQGRIIERMCNYGHKDKMVFVLPHAWQQHFKLLRQGEKAYADYALDEFDYEPPDLLTKHVALYSGLKGKPRQDMRNRLKKVETDHVAAFLIYQWVIDVGMDKILTQKNVQLYGR